jgi:hypothetical protein
MLRQEEDRYAAMLLVLGRGLRTDRICEQPPPSPTARYERQQETREERILTRRKIGW